jgi:WD40 repeat protein
MSSLLSLPLALLLHAAPAATPEPVLFAPGVVSTGHEEFGITFSPDGRTVVFNRADPTRFKFQLLMVSHWRDGRWTAPEVLPFSGRYRDIDPAFTPDGRRLFFASVRPQSAGEAVHADFDIWFVERTDKGWGTPRLAEGLNTPESETNTSVTREGAVYVTRSPKDGKRRIYRHAPQGAGWGPGEPLLEVINSGHGDGNHFVDAEERYLVFSSQRPGGLAPEAYDLYVSERKEGQWGVPRNLGPAINRLDGGLTPTVVPARGSLIYAQRRPFLSETPERPLTTKEFATRLESPGNGNGDFYEVQLTAVGLPAPGR